MYYGNIDGKPQQHRGWHTQCQSLPAVSDTQKSGRNATAMCAIRRRFCTDWTAIDLARGTIKPNRSERSILFGMLMQNAGVGLLYNLPQSQ